MAKLATKIAATGCVPGKNCPADLKGCTPGVDCPGDIKGCTPGVDCPPTRRLVDDEFSQLYSLDADVQPSFTMQQVDDFSALSVDAWDGGVVNQSFDDVSTWQSLML